LVAGFRPAWPINATQVLSNAIRQMKTEKACRRFPFFWPLVVAAVVDLSDMN